MPGLVGLITKAPRQRAERQLHAMLRTLRHNSSYVVGAWCDDSMGVYVGWTALPGSFSDGMPLLNERENAALIFSGEDHPEPGTRARLRERGHSASPEGPSYLVHLCEEDPSFPAGLNGWFHGLLIDQARKTSTLFNDRYGMHRLYYHESKDTFYFAAEAKAILAVCPELRRVDARGLGEYISLGCVLENRTLFEGVHALPPGSAWSFRNGSLENKADYFDPQKWEQQSSLEPEAYYQELREVFSRNLPRYFNGGRAIGSSLTGGLDTRMIMAWWKSPAGSLPCYTFGGSYRDCRDVTIARRVAKICGQPYQVIRVGDEFFSRFAEYAERTVYLSDGCAAVNRAADLYANEIAAQIAPVRMTGNYGSEILRRLRMFKPAPSPTGLFRPELSPQIEAASETYARWLPGHAVTFTAFRQAPWYQYGLLALEQTQVTMRSPYLDNDIVRTAFRAPNGGMVKSDLFEDSSECSRLIEEGNNKLHEVPTDRGLGGRAGRWSKPIERSFQEFTFRAEYAYDYGMPQWLARIDHALSPLHLERLFLGRHKFCHYRVWYRDELSDYIRDILLDSRSLGRPYVNGRALEGIVQGHTRGGRNYTSEIHQLLTLELVHRLFVDSK
jgi:asparagine synthase (glutamine-hydrolysing)